MKFTLQDRLLRRELGGLSRYSSIKGLYGDRAWVDDLDIVNELGGHSGCVNALSWSRSGTLLASGSDDQHLNIHSYQSDSSITPFALTTTVATGHTANIFSVKFMPHSADRTLVTAAGDSEVRVFDIEYAGRSAIPLSAPNLAASRQTRGLDNVYKGVRYLSYGDANARIYRSHSDRVKRIVTESSPHLFLTCSEDGEVRQWDLRLPSSSYPAPRGGRFASARRNQNDQANVPPPLISYKRFDLDLNSISCSGNQPHYIALGGAHLHCLLHDRRMSGRDLLFEQGKPNNVSPASNVSERDDELMAQATRCVRRFAPHGKKRMLRTDSGHITACKISDANPNEIICSYSGAHIYGFDLVQSPDARDANEGEGFSLNEGKGRSRVWESRDRKRKRKKGNSTSLTAAARMKTSEDGRNDPRPNSDDEIALRVRYQNGQTEDIPLNHGAMAQSQRPIDELGDVVMSESQIRSSRLAKLFVKLRKSLFSLKRSDGTASEIPDFLPRFTSILGIASTCLIEMDDIIRQWRYPLDPTREEVLVQQTLRERRDISRSFAQACGTLSRVLGGKLQTTSRNPSPALQYFQEIKPGPLEGPISMKRQIYNYDFLKAIILWLEGGSQSILDGFKRRHGKINPRFPIPNEAEESGIDEYLLPYLLKLAQERAIPNVDASRFERDEHRRLFESESDAVIAFGHAIRIPLEDLSQSVVPMSSSADNATFAAHVAAQDRISALKFWGFKVARGLLMNASQGLNFAFVDNSFGGLGIKKHMDEGRAQEDVDPEENEDVVEKFSFIRGSHEELSEDVNTEGSHDLDVQGSAIKGQSSSRRDTSAPLPREKTLILEERGSEEDVVRMEDLQNEIADHMNTDKEDNNEHDDAQSDDEDNDDPMDDTSNEDSEDDEDIAPAERQLMWQSAFDRSNLRERVEEDVPCSAHTRVYRGHCNVKTVKDVNFFGLQDEYVVSGSDSGHLFIWDKKSSELVNVLEGDGEVVNVVQGHPYEPILAVSGIDHTIKIFSPDARAQDDARAGVNLGTSAAGTSRVSYPSIRFSGHRQRNEAEAENLTGLASRKRMQDSYQIMNQNDVERRGGMQDTIITRGMMAQLAASLRAQRRAAAGQAGGEANDEGDERFVDARACFRSVM